MFIFGTPPWTCTSRFKQCAIPVLCTDWQVVFDALRHVRSVGTHIAMMLRHDTHVHVYGHTRAYIHTYTHGCKHTRAHTHLHMYVHSHIYICAHACAHTTR